MKIGQIIFFILAFGFCSGQKTVDAKLITKENDTISAKVRVTRNLIDPTLLYGSSFNKRVWILDDQGKTNKMPTENYKELSFVDYDGRTRRFINNSVSGKSFNELLFEGNNIQWFRAYESTMNGGENSSDFLFNKTTKKGIDVGYFVGIPRKKLKEFFADKPEIFSLIDEIKCSGLRQAENSIDYCMNTILQKYEALQSNYKIIR